MISEEALLCAASIEALNESEEESIEEALERILPNNEVYKKIAAKTLINPNFQLQKNLLFHKNAIYVPDDQGIKLRILQNFHDNKLAGHFGRRKTYELVKRYYFWPGMKRYIANYVSTCDQCHRNKSPKHKPYGLLRPLPCPERPWSSIGIDFIVKLPSSQGFDSICCVVDRLTKMAHFIECKESIDSKGLARLFVENIFKLHGLPRSIVSDRGSVFVSSFWQNLLAELDVKSLLSSAYHPQSDGQTERTNAILEQYLRIYCNFSQDDWSQQLPFAEFAYNNTMQDSIGKSPFEVNYGFHPTFSPEFQQLASPNETLNSYLVDLKELQGLLTSSIHKALRTHEKHYNKKHKSVSFAVGDKVWLLRKFIKTSRPSEKLDHRRLGPFKISEQINPVAFRLDLPAATKIHNVFHVSLLEPYHEDTNPLRYQPPPPPVFIDNEEEFEVNDILDSRIRRRRVEYLIDWKGYGPQDRTWQTLDTLSHCMNLLKEFHTRYPMKPGLLALQTHLKKGDAVKALILF